jgi:hypothetical protein
MDAAASFWNKIQLPSFMNILWSKLVGSSTSAAAPRRLQSVDRPTCLPPNCQLASSQTDLADFCTFLRAFYNTNNSVKGPTPISTLTINRLRTSKLRPILLRKGDGGIIVGSVSSQPIGTICSGGSSSTTTSADATFPLHYITNFCVHPQYRKRGLGAHLLNAVWYDLGQQAGGDACIFLKEGQPLFTAGPPLVSGRWIYRYCQPDAAAPARQIRRVAAADADDLIGAYVTGKQNVLFNKGASARSQTLIYEYRGLRGNILAAFTPAYQNHSSNGRPIYYQTGWLERGDILVTERVKAARDLSDCVGVLTAGCWVWCDWRVTNSHVLPPWRLDGPYYYYAFQWTAGIYDGSAELFLRL